jgi:hypothetical protein
MPKKVVMLKLFTSFLLCLAPTNLLLASTTTIWHQETWDIGSNTKGIRQFPVSVFVVTKSHWRADLIQKRFEFMNQALKTCNVGVSHVLYYKINDSLPKIHIDDGDKTILENGITHLANISPQETAIRMFYFDDYVDPISSAGSFPYSIPENSKIDLLPYHNTTWQPFYTPATIQNRTLPYSEDAHELGHVLLREGHDSSPVGNIMSDTSAIRINAFSAEQCARFKLPELKFKNSCDQIKSHFFPAFAFIYHLFSNKDGYTPLECGKNTVNLIRYLKERDLLNTSNAKIIRMIHKNSDGSITPTSARGSLKSWKHHVFLLMDGLVLDMDYMKEPRIVNLRTYMDSMWKNGLDDYLLQVRPWNEAGEFLHSDVLESFEKNEFKIYRGAEILDFVNSNSCQ